MRCRPRSPRLRSYCSTPGSCRGSIWQSNHDAINSIAQRNVGVIIQLSAVPPTEGDYRQPTVVMSVNFSALTPSDTEIGAGQKASAMRNIKLEHSEPLEFGRPLVMLAVNSSSVVEQVTPAVYVIRYLFSRPAGK